MLVKDFITKDIPVLKSFDTVEYALGLMDDLKLKQLPLVNEGVYRCLVSEKDLAELSDSTLPVGEPVLFAPAIKENDHLHKALAVITRYGLSLLPVVNIDGKYLGVLTRDCLLDALAELCCASAEGSVIVLEMQPQDYVLSDIARIVESNNAHVVNLLTRTDKDTGMLLVTIKIDLEDASPVIRSFERFNYNILYHFMEQGMVDDVLQQRMNELIYYMNM